MNNAFADGYLTELLKISKKLGVSLPKATFKSFGGKMPKIKVDKPKMPNVDKPKYSASRSSSGSNNNRLMNNLKNNPPPRVNISRPLGG